MEETLRVIRSKFNDSQRWDVAEIGEVMENWMGDAINEAAKLHPDAEEFLNSINS